VELYHLWPALQMIFSEHGVSRLQAQRNEKEAFFFGKKKRILQRMKPRARIPA